MLCVKQKGCGRADLNFRDDKRARRSRHLRGSGPGVSCLQPRSALAFAGRSVATYIVLCSLTMTMGALYTPSMLPRLYVLNSWQVIRDKQSSRAQHASYSAPPVHVLLEALLYDVWQSCGLGTFSCAPRNWKYPCQMSGNNSYDMLLPLAASSDRPLICVRDTTTITPVLLKGRSKTGHDA